MHQDLAAVLLGEHGEAAADAAQRLGAVLQHEITASTEAHKRALIAEIFDHEELVIRSLIAMIVADPLLSRKDDYTVMLTALRFAAPDAHRANLTILRHCAPLFPVIKAAFETDPDGYTCPELVSMLGSITTDEGHLVCLPFLYPLLDLLPKILTHVGVITVVAALLWVNLTRAEPQMAEPEADADDEAADVRPAWPAAPAAHAPAMAQRQPLGRPLQLLHPPALAPLSAPSPRSSAPQSAAPPSAPSVQGRLLHPAARPEAATVVKPRLTAPMTDAQLSSIHDLIFGALHAAFQGTLYMERRWGPLPTCLALSQLCAASSRNRQMIWRRQRVNTIAWVLAHPRQDMWPVRNFPAGYFQKALASALTCMNSLAAEGRLLTVVPGLLSLVAALIDAQVDVQVRNAALTLANTVVLQEQQANLQRLEPSVLAARKRRVAILKADHGSHSFERPLFENLNTHGWDYRMVGRRRRSRFLRIMSTPEADVADDIEACSALVVLIRHRRWGHSRHSLLFPLQYAACLRLPIIVVSPDACEAQPRKSVVVAATAAAADFVAGLSSVVAEGAIIASSGSGFTAALVPAATVTAGLEPAVGEATLERVSSTMDHILQELRRGCTSTVGVLAVSPDDAGAKSVLLRLGTEIYGDELAGFASGGTVGSRRRRAADLQVQGDDDEVEEVEDVFHDCQEAVDALAACSLRQEAV